MLYSVHRKSIPFYNTKQDTLLMCNDLRLKWNGTMQLHNIINMKSLNKKWYQTELNRGCH